MYTCLHAAHRNLGGKDHSCVDRSTGETVAYFKNKVFHRKQEGQLKVSSKVSMTFFSASGLVLVHAVHAALKLASFTVRSTIELHCQMP